MTRHGMSILKTALIALALGVCSASANAAGVLVGNLDDSNGLSSLFVGTVTQSGAADEIISLNLEDFSATDTNNTGANATDALAMTLYAPAGYVITSVSIAEAGMHNTTTGVTISAGSMTVGGEVVNLTTAINQSTNGNDSGWTANASVDLLPGAESVAVSVTNSLFAVGSTASVRKDSVVITAGLTAVPLPPAILMLGTAIAGLVSVSRRK